MIQFILTYLLLFALYQFDLYWFNTIPTDQRDNLISALVSKNVRILYAITFILERIYLNSNTSTEEGEEPIMPMSKLAGAIKFIFSLFGIVVLIFISIKNDFSDLQSGRALFCTVNPFDRSCSNFNYCANVSDGEYNFIGEANFDGTVCLIGLQF